MQLNCCRTAAQKQMKEFAMLNEEKVRLMTELASYEKNEGKKYLPVSKYYRSDYIGLALIKNFFLVTIAYVLLLLIAVGYYSEELLDNINQMNLIGIGIGLVMLYLILLVLYSLLIYVLYSLKYSKAKRSIKDYYAKLGEIAEMYVGNDRNYPQNKGRRRKS